MRTNLFNMLIILALTVLLTACSTAIKGKYYRDCNRIGFLGPVQDSRYQPIGNITFDTGRTTNASIYAKLRERACAMGGDAIYINYITRNTALTYKDIPTSHPDTGATYYVSHPVEEVNTSIDATVYKLIY
jgi:hypothetical protein